MGFYLYVAGSTMLESQEMDPIQIALRRQHTLRELRKVAP